MDVEEFRELAMKAGPQEGVFELEPLRCESKWCADTDSQLFNVIFENMRGQLLACARCGIVYKISFLSHYRSRELT